MAASAAEKSGNASRKSHDSVVQPGVLSLGGLLYPLVGFLVEWSLNGTLILIGSVILLCSFLSRVREEHLID